MSNPKLYWKDSGSGAWNDVANWWTDAEATTQADNAPWVDGVDSTYLAYDLTLATGAVDSPAISSAIGTGATGSCDIAGIITNNGYINSGTFSGDNFTNNGYINSGTFSGDNFTNNGYIYGGTFSGDNFTNNCVIGDGTFSGDNFTNNNFIIYETFTGNNFTNNGFVNSGTFACGDMCECGFQPYDSCYICGGGCFIACCDGTNCGSDNDNLGYCNGDATQDCAGNWYSPSNEDGNTYTDPNGSKCNQSSLDALGYCCGDATTDCAGNWYSPSNEDGTTWTDPNGTKCGTYSFDGEFGYCCGDSRLDCAGNWYSPSNEDGNTHTDPNGSKCNPNSVDFFGYCCGTCNDSSACGEDSNGCLYDNGCGCGVTCPPSGGGEDNNMIYRLVGLPWFVRPGNPDLASLIGLPPFINL